MAKRAWVLGAAVLGAVALPAPAAFAQQVDGPAVEVSTTEGLRDGDTVTVTGTGFDPAAGYYVSTCVAGSGGPAGPTCVGGVNARKGAVWVSNSPQAAGIGTPIAEDGSFTAELAVAASAEGVDCRAQDCAVTVFLDHRNGFGVVSETPVTFADAAPGGPGESTSAPPSTGAGPAEPEAPASTPAEPRDDGSGSAVWWAVGGAAVVAAATVAAVAVRKRR